MNSFRLLSRLKLALCLLLVGGVVPISACGDPDAGTISAPPRGTIGPGSTEDTSNSPKKSSPKPDTKTMTPGGKKIGP